MAMTVVTVRPQVSFEPAKAPDAAALRGGVEAFFSGAQWVGDGTELTVQVDGMPYTVNLELNVDIASGAFVGAGSSLAIAFAVLWVATGNIAVALLATLNMVCVTVCILGFMFVLGW